MGLLNLENLLKTQLGALFVLLTFVLFNLVLLDLSRLLLGFWQHQRVMSENGNLLQILTGGLRIDISTLCYLFALPLLLTVAATLTGLTPYIRLPLKFYLIAATLLLLFFELITPTFIIEYDLRPNRLFIDYIKYPKEVFSMLTTGYKLEIIVTLVVMVTAGYGLHKFFDLLWSPPGKGTLFTQLGDTAGIGLLNGFRRSRYS